MTTFPELAAAGSGGKPEPGLVPFLTTATPAFGGGAAALNGVPDWVTVSAKICESGPMGIGCPGGFSSPSSSIGPTGNGPPEVLPPIGASTLFAVTVPEGDG